ncbi:YAP1 binding protein 2 (ybp2) [Saccharomyces pastorianus]|uniref:YAP1 binding protein 2 (Ybp2) n=1 Tax=Saccharomyces pastorianus TaxID=27292 RepID=A0A6C1E794_SACPS|nr:YAP1 binding protein 2 (ybp2) [Saccharomyces pastorianus]
MKQPVETICDGLTRAFHEERDDSVSLVTIIDMYNKQVNSENSLEEKEHYLEVLLELLKEDSDVVKEIGWDLPKSLLKFFSSKNVDAKKHLALSPIVSSVMNCFYELATNGNPKECLLIACELVSSLSIDLAEEDESNEETAHSLDSIKDEATNHDNEMADICLKTEIYAAKDSVEFIPNLKIYALFELMSSTLKRVDTLYPSKFLAMAISAIVKYLKSNIEFMDDVYFILRRVYSFCVTYVAPQPSNNLTNGIDPSDLEKISKDESILQKKLLANLSVLVIENCLKKTPGNIDKVYYNNLMDKKTDTSEHSTPIGNICNQYYKYVVSLGVDVKQLFEECLEESKRIYDVVLSDSQTSITKSKEEINQLVYELSYAYQTKKLALEKNLELDQYGVIILSAIYYSSNGVHLLSQVDIQNSIYLYLRCTTASLFSETYDNKFLESAVRYWLWVSITRTSIKDIKASLELLPEHINTSFLQMLLMKGCNEPNSETKLTELTLLTRILCLMPEDTSFSFIFETLLHCPYITVKIAVLDILKDMMIKSPETCDSSTSTPVPEGNDNTPIPPRLPPRPYISINEDRMASIHSIAEMSFSTARQRKRTQGDLILVLTYMNFFVSLRNKWDLGLLTLVNNEISEAFQEEGEPELGFINIANDSLSTYIEEISKRL